MVMEQCCENCARWQGRKKRKKIVKVRVQTGALSQGAVMNPRCRSWGTRDANGILPRNRGKRNEGLGYAHRIAAFALQVQLGWSLAARFLGARMQHVCLSGQCVRVVVAGQRIT